MSPSAFQSRSLGGAHKFRTVHQLSSRAGRKVASQRFLAGSDTENPANGTYPAFQPSFLSGESCAAIAVLLALPSLADSSSKPTPLRVWGSASRPRGCISSRCNLRRCVEQDQSHNVCRACRTSRRSPNRSRVCVRSLDSAFAACGSSPLPLL